MVAIADVSGWNTGSALKANALSRSTGAACAVIMTTAITTTPRRRARNAQTGELAAFVCSIGGGHGAACR